MQRLPQFGQFFAHTPQLGGDTTVTLWPLQVNASPGQHYRTTYYFWRTISGQLIVLVEKMFATPFILQHNAAYRLRVNNQYAPIEAIVHYFAVHSQGGQPGHVSVCTPQGTLSRNNYDASNATWLWNGEPLALIGTRVRRTALMQR